MGAMNSGGNGIRMCTMVCNQRTVLGEYHCPVCKCFTDEKRCVCCQSPLAGHDVGKHVAVSGINRSKLTRMQNAGKIALPSREVKRQRAHRKKCRGR